VPALRSWKLPLVVLKLVVKNVVAVALERKAFLAKKLVVVLFVVEALIATKLVEVENIKLALEEKRLVEDARVLKSVVDVLLVITDEEASNAPVRVSVFTADL
jgi:hypothetical protein